MADFSSRGPHPHYFNCGVSKVRVDHLSTFISFYKVFLKKTFFLIILKRLCIAILFLKSMQPDVTAPGVDILAATSNSLEKKRKSICADV